MKKEFDAWMYIDLLEDGSFYAGAVLVDDDEPTTDRIVYEGEYTPEPGAKPVPAKLEVLLRESVPVVGTAEEIDRLASPLWMLWYIDEMKCRSR